MTFHCYQAFGHECFERDVRQTLPRALLIISETGSVHPDWILDLEAQNIGYAALSLNNIQGETEKLPLELKAYEAWIVCLDIQSPLPLRPRILKLFQTLKNLSLKQRPPKLLVIGSDLDLGMMGGESALVRSIALEWPKQYVRYLRLQDRPLALLPLQTVLDELCDHSSLHEVLYVQKQRRIMAYREVLMGLQKQNWAGAAGQIWLVTGALSDLMFAVLQRWLPLLPVQMVLLGRTPFEKLSELQLDRYHALQQCAQKALCYYDCELQNQAALQQVLENIQQQQGLPSAILHAAAWIRDAGFRRTELEDFEMTWDVKFESLHTLIELMGVKNLNFVFAMTSWAGFLGNYGQVAYAAANQAVDSMLLKLGGQYPGLKTLAVSYPPILQSGLSKKLSDESLKLLEEAGIAAMTLEEMALGTLAVLEHGALGHLILGKSAPPSRL